MENSRRRIRECRSWEAVPTRAPESVLVEVPGKWTQGVVSLIKASQEFRQSGLMVTNVGPGSQGARAGMVPGDVLLRYEGQELESVATLRNISRAYTQGALANKALKIEAARGSEDLAFEVLGGHLGITVSPLLHRSVTPTFRGERILHQVLGDGETAERASPRVLQTLEEARSHGETIPAFVLVPGELARPVLAVLRAIEKTGSRKRRNRAKSLLKAVLRRE
jgi:membrane-associated protease RseP (regulator of RpoE activity)